MISMDNPSVDIGVRGLSYIEVEVTGPNRDLHSGVYGGAVANPITILARMIASCHDENNHITIPGFYDDVLEISAEERKLMAKAPYNEKAYEEDLGVKALWGEKGYTTNERTGIRPTLELNGIWGGYTVKVQKQCYLLKLMLKFQQDLFLISLLKLLLQNCLSILKILHLRKLQ